MLQTHYNTFRSILSDGTVNMKCKLIYDKICQVFSQDTATNEFMCQLCCFTTKSINRAEKHHDDHSKNPGEKKQISTSRVENFGQGPANREFDPTTSNDGNSMSKDGINPNMGREEVESSTIYSKKHSNSMLFRCDLCSYTAVRNSHVKRHYSVVHTEIGKGNAFACPNCNLCFANQVNLDKHYERFGDLNNLLCIPQKFLKTLDVQKQSYYNCSECNYMSNKRSDYVRHVSNIHLKEARFACGFCDLAFIHQVKLFDHIMENKIGETDHMICGYYRFKPEITSDDLPRDMETGDVQCPMCPFRSNNGLHVEKHIKNKHNLLKSYTCLFCNESCSEITRIKDHLLIVHNVTENSNMNQVYNTGEYPQVQEVIPQPEVQSQ